MTENPQSPFAMPEQIGQEMLENLSHDREKIQRARERLRETDANLGKSSRILTGMLRRTEALSLADGNEAASVQLSGGKLDGKPTGA
ncbi:hypothetical protein ASZ78_006707 [Callipepla squamata]|uniref:t-SNARE coiled-coil homology domain-containing protein n=1 Tax=Callipepla squamata TaxID=9009 RepID=A0A226N3X8_CALSU|nr:hypothetical protein ASZ78_006707 [Callipepla squamata]